MSGGTLRLYHYTTKEGKDGIESSGYIMQSTDTVRDARQGPGARYHDSGGWMTIPAGNFVVTDDYFDGCLLRKILTPSPMIKVLEAN